MGKSLYATVKIVRLGIYAPNEKKYPKPLFYIDTYGLVSSSSQRFNFTLSRKFFEKYANEPQIANKLSLIGRLIESNDEIRKEFLDEINTNLYPKSSVHVVFSKLKTNGMIEFMNEIGDQGWDTSGQLPSTDGGPTYVTMMRKRIS